MLGSFLAAFLLKNKEGRKMPIVNIVIMVLGFILLAFMPIIYIFNPFKWRFIKRSREDEALNKSIELYNKATKESIELYNKATKESVELYNKATKESVELYSKGRETLSRFVDYVEKMEDFGNIDPFTRYNYGWIAGVPIFTVYSALEGLRLVEEGNFFEKNEQDIDACIFSYFREKKGFCLSRMEEFPSIHASYCALNATKSVVDKRCEQRLTYKNAVDKLTPRRVDTVLSFLHECGGNPSQLIVDNPHEKEITTINVLHNTSRLLWNLDREEELFKIIEKDRLIKFLKDCFSGYGFTGAPNDGRVSVEATYFALRILEILPQINFIKSTERTEIATFLHSCWQGDGFSSDPERAATLNHTFFTLLSYGLIDKGMSLDWSKMLEFVQSCKSGLGFGSRQGLEATGHATRCAVQILDYLKSRNLVDESLISERKEEMARFFKGSLAYFEPGSS